MESPSPLPSVVRATSPRMNRSVNSEAGIFNGFSEIFLIVTVVFLDVVTDSI